MKKTTIERTFYAPIEKVWQAFTVPKVLKRWWSPEGMEPTNISVDLKEGGMFRFCFKSQDQKLFCGRGTYIDISRPTKLSYLDTFSDVDGEPVPPSYFGMPGDEIIEALVEINLSQKGNKTLLNITMDNHNDETMTKDMIDGWNSMFDKLQRII
ncbi:hypothetical protein COV93_08945 [Candidatus Woesearchaeota archaeon CG11_big_fil_rev_8_21_14_0_20_43_8]|nr:MAG: hypothetical protein COV93_08945 [Candidatus Woesearchaeota archaeon CG11_big_fil_rev_8_21_14_0_20_43_8]PIO04559.1 MAG: hypothetical protein COT47_08490 [Candidatus Woesearchaeota archaeon CG08_land_8_20_14_0_20_43_7]